MDISRRNLIIAAGASTALATPTIIPAFALRGQRIHVSDFGARADTGVDATLAVRSALQQCDGSNSTLIFEPGRYVFGKTGGNVIDIKALNTFEIEGNGADFLFDGIDTAFSVRDVRGLSVRDISMDWRQPTFSQGRIGGQNLSEMTVDVVVDDTCSLTECESIYAVHIYDASTGAPAVVPRGAQYGPHSWELISSRVVRLKFSMTFDVPVGDVAVLFHSRDHFAFIMDNSSDISLNRVIIRTAPGMAVSGTAVQNISFDKCQIAPDPLSGRLISSAADGIHFWSTRGQFQVSDCLFEGTGDDCINVHSFLLSANVNPDRAGVQLAEKNRANGRDRPLNIRMIPSVGDILEVLDSQSLDSVGQYVVVSVDGRTLIVSPNLPRGLSSVYIVDKDHAPDVVVRKSLFRRSTGVGVLARKSTLIENCKFEDMGWLGVNSQVDTVWLEGPFTESLSIQSSEFRGCGRGLGGTISCSVLSGDKSSNLTPIDYRGAKNISICGCKFDENYGTDIHISSSENINISGNRFHVSNESINPTKEYIASFTNVAKIIFEKNSCNKIVNIAFSGKNDESHIDNNFNIVDSF